MHVTQNNGACHTRKRKKVYNLSSVFQLNGFKCKAGLYVKRNKLKYYVGSLIQFIFKHLYMLYMTKKHVTHNSDACHTQKKRKKEYKLPGRETLQHP